MKAAIYHRYGSPDVLQLVELPTPVPAADQALIKIHAVSINGSDREGLSGSPLYARMRGLIRPGGKILGSDIAGTVVAVGSEHGEFQTGDEVFGELPGYHGGFAEYAVTHGRTLARKPAELSFEQAAAIPQAGVIALHGIHIKGQVQRGQKVLINGAGGSGGTFAIQLAKHYGAEVTGVDHAGKLEFMRSLGADHVIDFTRQDYTRGGEQYDLILDLIAHRPVFAAQRALKPGGTYYVVGGAASILFQTLLFGPSIRKRTGKNVRVLMVPQSRKDLLAITELCVSGPIVPVIDRSYPLSDIREAMRYVSEGHAQGKVVVVMDTSGEKSNAI